MYRLKIWELDEIWEDHSIQRLYKALVSYIRMEHRDWLDARPVGPFQLSGYFESETRAEYGFKADILDGHLYVYGLQRNNWNSYETRWL